jgi:hypothetical protein
MSDADKLYLLNLLRRFREGTIDTEVFCARFEHTFNLELDQETLSGTECAVLKALFGKLFGILRFRPNARTA